jgi:hypothetical protein
MAAGPLREPAGPALWLLVKNTQQRLGLIILFKLENLIHRSIEYIGDFYSEHSGRDIPLGFYGVYGLTRYPHFISKILLGHI